MIESAFIRYIQNLFYHLFIIQYTSMILMTSLCTTASHQIFCPIKGSLE